MKCILSSDVSSSCPVMYQVQYKVVVRHIILNWQNITHWNCHSIKVLSTLVLIKWYTYNHVLKLLFALTISSSMNSSSGSQLQERNIDLLQVLEVGTLFTIKVQHRFLTQVHNISNIYRQTQDQLIVTNRGEFIENILVL